MDGQTIKQLVAIFLAAILTENYILNKFHRRKRNYLASDV